MLGIIGIGKQENYVSKNIENTGIRLASIQILTWVKVFTLILLVQPLWLFSILQNSFSHVQSSLEDYISVMLQYNKK